MTDSYQELYLGEESGSYHLTITAFENIFFSVLGVLIGVLCGWLLYRMVRAFLPVRPHWGTPLLAVTMGISAVMVIWVGDPNLLYTLPFYVTGFMLSTRGDRVGRITLCFIFFCMSMSIAALLDTYIGYGFLNRNTDLATRCGRLIITLAIYLGFHRFLPKEPPLLSRNLWMLTLALSLLPMAALCSTVLLTYPRWESEAVLNVSLRVGLGILPFVLITSIVLLAAIIVLARQNAMEQEQALAAQRAIYYEGLQQQDQQLRQLRHDLRNHITADFQVALPADLAIADTDLCALLGNALDNAREGAAGIAGATVRLRCRIDKGLFMLAVDNPTRGDVRPDLATTKRNKRAHGHGLASMRNIAARYSGTLETRVEPRSFHLLVCLSPTETTQ